MATVRIPVKPDILKWVSNQSGNLLTDDWKSKLEQWTKQEKQPTVNQLKQLSQKTKIPFGYFFLQNIPKEEIPLLKFRTINNYEIEHPSRDLIDTIVDMETKQDWLSNYRQKQGFPKNNFYAFSRHINNISQLSDPQKAQNILECLDLSIGWNFKKGVTKPFKKLRQHLNNAGITVMTNGQVGNNTRRPLDQNEFRAFALADDYAPLIFINSNDSYRAMLFSLVHELVHLWFGTSELFNADLKLENNYINSLTEQDINQISEEIIFPKELFLQLWRQELTDDDDQLQQVLDISKKFGASPLSTGIRSLHLNLIPQKVIGQLQDYLQNEYDHKKLANKESSGAPKYYVVRASRIDHNFVEDVNRSAKSGQTTYTEAFELLNVKNNNSFNKLVNEVRGEKND
ncbi:ImmA/IrrE family metallo-endopeptidase [Levilactobacillus acidifarinae]|nr:ImmA/IrrE family metallo-endopeptidase [Levilactobacillus acidifarinae]GEO69206.1 hypothetical protein LAC03_11160 [Levilactobacillus acidifarinae]